MFNNCNEMTNGEYRLLESIKNDINVIFDVGSRSDNHYNYRNIIFFNEKINK